MLLPYLQPGTTSVIVRDASFFSISSSYTHTYGRIHFEVIVVLMHERTCDTGYVTTIYIKASHNHTNENLCPHIQPTRPLDIIMWPLPTAMVWFCGFWLSLRMRWRTLSNQERKRLNYWHLPLKSIAWGRIGSKSRSLEVNWWSVDLTLGTYVLPCVLWCRMRNGHWTWDLIGL